MECIAGPSVGKVRPREKIQGVFGPNTLQLVCSHIHLRAEIQLFFWRTLKKQTRMFCPPSSRQKSAYKPPHKNKEPGLLLSPHACVILFFIMCTRWHANKQKACEESDWHRWLPELHFYFYYTEAYLAVTLLSAFSNHIIKLRQTLTPLPPAPGTSCPLNLLFKNAWTRLWRCEPKSS